MWCQWKLLKSVSIFFSSAAGRGGASIYGAEFDDEIHSELKHTGAGVLSMANSGPNTNGSQFFITLAQAQWLDGKHAIFGRISSGMSCVKRIGMVEKDPNDRPVDDIKIVRAYLTPVWNYMYILKKYYHNFCIKRTNKV